MEREPKIEHHHILHNRQEWELRVGARALRQCNILIPELDSEHHLILHNNCPPIPLLGPYALEIVTNEFEPTRNIFTTMDRLMSAIDIAGNHSRAHPIERDLAQLAIQAIDLQKPYIKDGLMPTRR